MKKFLLATLFVLLSSPIFANANTTAPTINVMDIINSPYNPDYEFECHRFFNPRMCDRHPGCEWDYYRHRCERRDHFNECFRFDRWECERHHRCEWNFYRHRCIERFRY